MRLLVGHNPSYFLDLDWETHPGGEFVAFTRGTVMAKGQVCRWPGSNTRELEKQSAGQGTLKPPSLPSDAPCMFLVSSLHHK